MWTRTYRSALAVLLLVFMAVPSWTQEPTQQPTERQRELAEAFDRLAPKYQQWLRSVIGLMSQNELDFFIGLKEDYRRDAFMEAFWKPRDPDPRTPVNELRARWEEYQSAAGGYPYGDPRFRLYLLQGPPTGWVLPDGRSVTRCFSRTQELEIWFYDGTFVDSRDVAVVFFRRAESQPYEIFLPGDRIRPILRSGGLPTTDIRLLCAEEVLGYVQREMQLLGGYPQLLEKILTPVLPSPEWLSNFSSSAADLPEGAETFDVGAVISYPARNQSRTAVQVLLSVPRRSAPGQRFDGELFHDFLLVGEILRDGQLFESFRYRFEGPTPEETDAIPLGITRYLRQGPASIRLLLEDVYGHRYARVVRDVEVPSPDGRPPIDDGEDDEAAAAETAAERPVLRLAVPPGNVLAGKIRFRATAFGGADEDEIDKVTFYLDGKEILSKRRPPYSAELDLGEAVEPHRVRVVGFAGDREVATDQIWLNQGSQRFRLHLIEPRAGGIYPGSVTARIEVDTPDGQNPDRVEVYLDGELEATLAEPPYAQSLRLTGGRLAVVRAVAYLADGSSTDDAVVVNAAAFSEAVEVRLVEVPVVVTDRDGRPLTGLKREQFRLVDGGAERQIERFEEASGAAINAALLIDRSASMAPHLGRVTEAAFAFTDAVRRKTPLTPALSPEGERESDGSRVAVFSFADQLSVDSGFDASPAQAERALAGLVAHGGTAFYDSLVQALNNFDAVAGPSALVVFSDGRDEGSRLTLEQTLETARRAGVTIYSIGLEEAFPERATRRTLEELTSETGGRAYFLAGLDELSGTYDGILEELGSRYLLAFAPSADGGDEFRVLRVEVDVRGAEVRARRGYYP